MQSITLMGNLGRDPEEKQTNNGHTVTTFSLGVPVYANKETKTQWYKINVWNQYLSNIVKHLKKGSFVLVQGDLELPRVYKGADGSAKIDLGVNATSIKFVSPKKEEQTPQQAKEAAIKEGASRYKVAGSSDNMYAESLTSDTNEKLPF